MSLRRTTRPRSSAFSWPWPRSSGGSMRAWVLTSFTRIFLIFERRPHESRLMQDVVVGVIYLGAALSVVAYVFNVARRHPDRHVRRVRHHPGPGPAEHAGRRLLGRRPQSQPRLQGRRLDRAERWHPGTRRRDQLAWHQPAQRGQRPRRSAEQQPGQGAGHQSQQPQPQPWREAQGAHDADHGAFGDLGGHAQRAAEQQLHPVDTGADGGDQRRWTPRRSSSSWRSVSATSRRPPRRGTRSTT